ncbi:MAG: hypothetical protein RL685_7846 [Pseudomonadota bacterium]
MAVAPPVEVAALVKAERPIEEDSPAQPPSSQWSYDESPDSMGKGKIRTADVFSSNEVEFDFPYHVPQRALLLLRTHPRHGRDVLFKLQRGQFLCSPFDDCQVLVRFDDEAAVRYAANTPEDNSNETLFIGNYSRFFEKLTKAKRVRISANVFHQGTPMFEFDVSGFDSDRYKGEPTKDNSR